MPMFLISFPSSAMVLTEDEFPGVAAAANAIVDEIKAAGIYVFAEGLDDQQPATVVSQDGTVSAHSNPETAGLNGGMTIIDVPTRKDAEYWAAKVAVACRCPQELRAFGIDMDAEPES